MTSPKGKAVVEERNAAQLKLLLASVRPAKSMDARIDGYVASMRRARPSKMVSELQRLCAGRDSNPERSAEAGDRMRPVAALQPLDLGVAERDVQRSEGVLQVLHPGDPDDRRGHHRVAQQPGQRDLRP